MSNIRLVKKDENHDNIRFGINQSYYNEVVRRLQNTNVNETVDLINSGKYLDSNTLKKHKEKLKQYKSDFEYLNEIQKLTSNDYDESSYIETSKWLEDFTNAFNERESILSKFKDELEYNDAVKIGELNEMPSAEILPHIDTPEVKDKRNALVSRQRELEEQLRELGASGNKGVGAKKKSTLTQELNDVKKQISDLEKSKIAYTTSSGQNITWSSLYDKKKAEEDFNALYGELSASEDWKEKSQYLSTNKKGTARSNALLNPSVDWDYEDINKYSPYVTGGGFSADRGYAEQTTDKEKAIFNYLYHTQGKEAAMEWHKSREDIYRDRAETKGIETAVKFAEDYPVLSDVIGVGASIVSGGEYIGDFLKGDIGDTNQTAAVSSAIKGTRMEQIDWEVGEWDVFDFLYGTGTSLVESATSMAMFGTGGGFALGLSAAAQSTNDALNRGMSKGQAFTSGVASGIFEGIFETWSIGAFGDLTKNLKRADFRNIAKYIGKNMWNNAKEETLTEIANIAYDTLINGDFSQYETAIRQYMDSGMSESDAKKQVAIELGGQVVEAGASGALMGFGFGVGGAAKARNNITQMGREIKDSGETRNLVDLGKSLGEGTEAYEFASKITDKSKAFAIGQLLGIASEDIQSANIGDIVKSLERKGYNTDVANNLAEMMLDPDNTMFENSRGISAPSKTYNDIINNPNSTVGQRNEAYQGILRSVAENRAKKEENQKNKTNSKSTNTAQSILPLSPNYVEARTKQLVASGIPIEQAVQVAQGEFANNQSKMSTQTEKAVESKFESNPEGKDINIANEKIITSKKLVASDRDNMAFEVTYDDGTTENVNANDISFGNEGEALVYSSVMDMNVPVGIAESLIKGYNGNDINSAGTYVNGMREAFTFGKHNQEADLKNGAYSSQLTEEQRNFAFNLGKIYAKDKAIADEKAIQGETKPTDIKKQDGKVHFEGDKLSLKSVQDVSLESLNVLTKAIGKDIHIFESYVDKNGKRVYKNTNGEIKSAPNGFYNQKDGSIWIDLNAGNRGEGVMMYTVAHELTHFIKQWSPTKFKALADFIVEQYGKKGVSVDALVREQQKKAKDHGRNISYDVAFEEMVADSMETMLTDGKVIRELAKKDKGLFNKIKSWIDNLLRRLNKEYKNYSPESKEGQLIYEAKEIFTEVQKLFADALVDASDNFAIKGSDKAFVESYLKTQDVVYNLRAAESHQEKLAEKYTTAASIDLETLQKRYAKIIGIWEKLGGELNSKFLNEWNNKVGKDRAFTIFKAQSGYKYNVELSSMCKKGVPLFEAIDTIVKKEVMNELKTKTLGKAEKEILYDILKNHNFEIPCAICYVEQARQREGVIINDFLDGKIEKNAKGKITKYKLGWNDVLNRVEKEMKKNGVDYTFRNVDKSIATDSYAPSDIIMDEATQDAFYKALKKVANAEIVRWNREDRKSNQPERRQITDLKPQTIKAVFKGTLPSNLKIFKVLFNNPSSRFKISRDLLYSSATTLNLANAHNDLYSLFNSQGGVAGYKTKQAPIVYWGDILGKSWQPSTVRKEGGIRNQSNSDFQMYTLLDHAQMYIDFSAKGYYLQAYTKVLSELKLFGLSRGKINASLIPQVIEYKNADGSINWEKTMENAGLDENGNPIYDDFEGINHTEAFMLIEDAEYSKNICGICIGYSDNHIRKLLDDNRVQQIIGFHDKTDNPEKRYRGAKYAKNYNGLNEAVKTKADGTEETVHIGFNQFVSKAEKMFKFNKKTETFEGTVNHNGKEYTANDIPRLAADLYLEMCEEKNYKPAYNDFSSHKNYYKLLADFGLYDSQGNYAPHQKVQYNMPDQVPYLDKNGNKAYMSTEAYIKAELQKELKVRDSISEALADTSENGIIPQFVERVNALHSEKADTTLNSLREIVGEDGTNYGVGVYLDSQELAILSEEERENAVINHIKKLGGHPFSAFDNDGNEVKIKVAPNTRYETEKGSRERANRHLINFLANKEKQESLMLIDEIIGSATFKGKEPATKAHGWLDNNGKNEWDVWTTYIQDKENTIWVAKLKVANTTNGEKVLYDVHPIEKVGQGRTLPTIPTKVGPGRTMPEKPTEDKIPQDTTESQELFSERVTDKETLDFLNKQMASGEVTKVYRAMQVQPVDENGNVIKAAVMRVVSYSPLMVEAKTFGKNGKVDVYPAKLFSPMAGMVNGKWSKSIDLNEWEETTFDLAHATTMIDEKTGKPKIDNDKKNASYGETAYYYGLVKGGIDEDGKKLTDVPARYNPYIHTSLSALNDQFSSANKRPELVTVECIIPNSELTSGFRAEGAKDRVGAMNWHSGPTSSRLAKVGKARTVILTRYDMPIRVLPDSEVANAVAEYIGDTENIAIQGSTVTPSLSRELMNLGISVLNEEQWSRYSKDFPAKTFGKKNENTTTDTDVRYSERVLMGSLFSGGGTLEAGLVYQMLDKEFAVEFNKQIASVYTDNHGKEHMFVGDVRDFNSKDKQNVFYLHASPVCKNFSSASHSGGETTLDITTAQATARVLEEQMPQVFTVENVKRYIGSEAYNIITNKLDELGYTWDVDVYKASNYGNATKRERMIIRAVKSGQLPAKPQKVSNITSWGEATRDLWETDLTPSYLVRSKIEAIKNTPSLKDVKLTKLDRPLMIYDTTKSKTINYAWADELAPTLTTKCGDARIIMPDGRVYAPTPKFMGRIQGLPDDYKYPKSTTRAFTIIGNGIPTQLTKAVMGGVLDSAYEQTHDGEVLYSDRDDSSVSTRSLLANALEGAAQNDIEKNKLAQYKEKIALIESEQKKLHELREKLFTKGIKGDERREIQEEATRTANRITTYDRQLFNLEATTALKNVLNREKELARKRQKLRDAENLKAYKEQRDAEVDYLIKKNKKAIESRQKTVLKHKISDVLFKLDGLLNRGNKKRNIKQGLQQTVGSALNLGRMLFNSNIENEDIIRFGISALTEKEKVVVAQYQRLLAKKDAFYKELDELQSKNMEGADFDRHDYIMLQLDKINEQMRNLDKVLADVFERERARLNETEVTELVEKLAHDFAMLKESKDEYIKNSFDEYKYNRLITLAKALKGTTVKDMNKAQLQETYDAFKMIEHAVRTANQLFFEGQKADLMEYVENVQSEVKDNTDEKKDRNAIVDKTLSVLNKFTWENLRPVDAFVRLGSKTFEKLFWNAIDGLSKAGRMAAEAGDFIEEARKKYGYSKWDLEVAPKTFITTDGKEFKPSLADMMSIYAYSFREQAIPHMTEGGFTYDTGRTYKDKTNDDGKGKKGQTKVHKMSDPYILSATDINNIISTLSEEQRAYVKECLPYFQVLATEGNKVSMVLHGIEIFKDKAYFPLKSSYDYLSSTAEVLNNAPTMASLQNMGMTKETTPGANNPIVLRGFDDVLSSHIEDMASYCSLALPITNLRKVFDNVGKTDADKPISTKALISSRFGAEAKEYFADFITDLNGGIKGGGASGLFDKLFSRAKGVSVAANMSVIVQQYFAIIRAMEIIDPKHFGAINKELSAKDMKEYEELCKYSGIAIIKEIGGYDVGAKGRVKDYINDRQAHKDLKYIRKKTDDVLMWGASAMDKLGWTTIWKAVKKEVVAEGGYTVGSEEFLKACAKRFNEVVTKTQVYDSVASRSGYMRSQHDAVKYATSFMSEPTVMVGRMFVRAIELVRAIEHKDKSAIKQAGSMFVRVALTTSVSQVLGKLAQSLIYGGRDDDEDEAFLEKWLSAFVENMHYDFKYLGLNNLPFTRDVISIIDGWTVDRPDMTLIEDVVNAINKSVTDGCTLDEAINLVGTIGNILGIPVKNIVREFKSIVNFYDDVFVDDIKPTNLKGAIAEGFSGDDYSKVEKLFSVYESGDTQRVKDTVADWVQEKFDSYKEEEDDSKKAEKKAIQSVRASVTSKYRDEYKNAFKNKDSTEMNEIRKFLYATGLWKSLSELDSLLAKWREAD